MTLIIAKLCIAATRITTLSISVSNTQSNSIQLYKIQHNDTQHYSNNKMALGVA